jgi:anti-anti-sigma factor
MSAGETFRISRTARPNHNLIRIEGELDMATLPKLELVVDDIEAKGELPDKSLVIDLRLLTFIDSMSVRVILDTHRKFAKTSNGPTCVLVCPKTNRAVYRVIDLIGLDQVIEVVETVEDAAWRLTKQT